MLSIPDMAVLGGLALLIFGPDQLPKVARKAGGFMREVQNTSQSFIREMERAADVSEAPKAAPPPVWEPSPPVAEVVAEPRSAGEAYVDPYASQPHSAFDPAPPQSDVPERPEIAAPAAPAAQGSLFTGPEPSLQDDISHPSGPDPVPAVISQPAQTTPQPDHTTHV
jgi:sec-independent protein translocase protein TatA